MTDISPRWRTKKLSDCSVTAAPLSPRADSAVRGGDITQCCSAAVLDRLLGPTQGQ